MNTKEQIELYNAALAITNFCYDENGNWIGTENIKANWRFINLVSRLVDILEKVQPTMDEFRENEMDYGDLVA